MVEHVCVLRWVDNSFEARMKVCGVQTFANGL
ncbi:MAG: hypothetical protein QOD30_1047 [Actinomycetota bacterium]|nr:hypothetical protein [Actinomycetota bacterium]